jgi:hypothetical protein
VGCLRRTGRRWQPSAAGDEINEGGNVVTEARLERVAVMEKAILVEGITDAAAVRTMARRAGRDLDAEGVAVVTLGGGGGLETYLRRLGPDGLGLELLGLCDVDHEARWARRLERAGLGSGSDLDRAAMEALGFFVCDRDLEDELIKALGVDAVESLIAEQGDLHAFQTLTKQPYHRDGNRLDQLRRFLTSQSGRKRYIPLLVESLEPGAEPRPLRELLARA